MSDESGGTCPSGVGSEETALRIVSLKPSVDKRPGTT